MSGTSFPVIIQIDPASMVFMGFMDCSQNPFYPSAERGWVFVVNVPGKIGGENGVNVSEFDVLICVATAAAGDQSEVGSSWAIQRTQSLGGSRVLELTDDYTLLPSDLDGNTTITNEGAAKDITITLPDGVTGYQIRAIWTAAHYMKFIAPAGETIQYQDQSSDDGGYIRTNVVGTEGILTWIGNLPRFHGFLGPSDTILMDE